MRRFFLFLCGLLLLGGCRSVPKEAHIDWSPPEEESPQVMYRIADHKMQALGRDLPMWVIRYDAGGVRQIERLPEYQNRYVFVGETSGANFRALSQWNAGFAVSHDFARLVALRMQARFAAGTDTFPDQEFGSFFETSIKGAYDAAYTGAVREDDFWVKKQYVAEDGFTTEREEYAFFVLISIDEAALQAQINAIFQAAPPESLLITSKQRAASVQLIKTFFDNF